MARIDPLRRPVLSRWALVGLALLFIGPVLLSWTMFQTRDLWWSGATTNYGELITPARPVALTGLQTYDGEPFDGAFLRGHWTLVILAVEPGDAASRESLYLTRQVRTSLEKDQERVQRLLVLERPPSPELRDELGRIDSKLSVAVAPENSLAQIRREFSPGESSPAEGIVYLIDPLGNLMMRYPAGFAGKRMLKDLKRLLKVSQIG